MSVATQSECSVDGDITLNVPIAWDIVTLISNLRGIGWVIRFGNSTSAVSKIVYAFRLTLGAGGWYGHRGEGDEESDEPSTKETVLFVFRLEV